MVLADSHGISRAPCYLGYFPPLRHISTTGLAPTVVGLSKPFVYMTQVNVHCGSSTWKSHNPDHATPAGLAHDRFSLIRFRSPLLTESLLFSLPAGTEMFHFPAFPLPALCVQTGVTPHDWCRVPPFGHPGITARLPAPRGLSQAPTSFIGSWCQDIHRMPLPT